MDRRTDRMIEGWTDTLSYRDARTYLEMKVEAVFTQNTEIEIHG